MLEKGLSAPEESGNDAHVAHTLRFFWTLLTMFWLCVGSGSAPCSACGENVERRRRLQDRVQQMEVGELKKCVMLLVLLG